MKGESTRRVPPEKAATSTEIASAIDALSAADFVRLGSYANQRVQLIGPKAKERTGDDLLQIAVQDLLEDTRRWDKSKVGLMGFLFGAMKSISSNWAKSYQPEDTAVLEADLRKRNEEGKITSPIDGVAVAHRTAEEHLVDVETLAAIDSLFKDDQEAQMILTAWQDGYDPAGVRDLWGLSQNDYNTVVRRIRRTIAAANIKPEREKGAKYVQ